MTNGRTEFPARQLRAGLVRQTRAFGTSEDGSLLVFGLFCFVSMLLLAGVALDLMRFEERRTILQATLDRAVLAAADMDQTLPCEDVIQDWFEKAGETPPAEEDISCTRNDFGSEVEVQTSAMLDTWFMDLVGVETLTTPAAGTAEEKIGKVEISLILDVSGSMNSNSRLTNLKPAAKAFVDQMFDNVEEGNLSMSIVTYSTQVATGPDLLKYFHNTAEHSYSTCLEFNATDFQTSAVSPKSTAVGMPAGMGDRQYQLNGHFDPFYTVLTSDSQSLMNCPPSNAANANRYTTVLSGDRNALKAKIDSLAASGNTSIDIGMKWGTALLDPSMQPVVTSMIAEGKVSADFEGRPYDYPGTGGSFNTDVLKVVVLMTDGENTTEYKLKDVGASGYDSGASRLYMNNTTSSSYNGSNYYKRFSLYDSSKSGSNKYFSLYTNSWRSEPWGTQASDISGTDTTTQLTWPQVWNLMSVNWFADNIIYKVYGSTSTRNSWRTSASSAVATSYVQSSKDTYTNNICTAAKSHGIKVFTIGFEAPTAGKTLLKNCASSPAHFYSVAGLDISTAFASIANSINKLRLTH